VNLSAGVLSLLACDGMINAMRFLPTKTWLAAGINSALILIAIGFSGLQAQTPPQSNQTKPPAAPSPTPPAAEEIDPDDVIRVKTSLVSSPVLVIGRNGKFVPSLKQDEFQIFEDGVQQEVAYFAPVENPVTVALLLDTSRSALFNLVEIQDAALALVDNMRPQDQALVISFAGDITLLADVTSDRAVLRQAIRSSRPGGDTRLYDAIDLVLTKHLSSVDGRKALLLFTDGVDNASRSSNYESSALNVQRSEALIYPVQFNTYHSATKGLRGVAPVGSGFNKEDYVRADAYLHLLSDLSGTGVHPAVQISDLDRAVSKIVDELHNEYSLGYYPRAPGQPGQVRRLEVRLKQRQFVVRSRTAYVVDQNGAAMRMAKSEGLQVEPGATSAEMSLPVPVAKDSRPQLGARWICKGPNVPTDFAVAQEGLDSMCPPSTRANDQTNAWFIRKPGQVDVLCKGFVISNGREVLGVPIPTGYVVTGEAQSKSCAKSANPMLTANAWTIRLPQGRETICKGFMIPRGYVVVSQTTKAECPVTTRPKNAWVIQIKK